MKALFYAAIPHSIPAHVDIIFLDGAKILGKVGFCKHDGECPGRVRLPAIVDLDGITEPKTRVGMLNAVAEPRFFSEIVPLEKFETASGGIIKWRPATKEEIESAEVIASAGKNPVTKTEPPAKTTVTEAPTTTQPPAKTTVTEAPTTTQPPAKTTVTEAPTTTPLSVTTTAVPEEPTEATDDSTDSSPETMNQPRGGRRKRRNRNS